jgi:hypothetical protein
MDIQITSVVIAAVAYLAKRVIEKRDFREQIEKMQLLLQLQKAMAESGTNFEMLHHLEEGLKHPPSVRADSAMAPPRPMGREELRASVAKMQRFARWLVPLHITALICSLLTMCLAAFSTQPVARKSVLYISFWTALSLYWFVELPDSVRLKRKVKRTWEAWLLIEQIPQPSDPLPKATAGDQRRRQQKTHTGRRVP